MSRYISPALRTVLVTTVVVVAAAAVVVVVVITVIVGWFHPFYRPRRPFGRVQV
jgi:hypothetical protein